MPSTARRKRSPDQYSSVVKTLWPPQPGTIGWWRQYGKALVCVRYRRDASGMHRITTVELIVAKAAVSGKAFDEKLFKLHLLHTTREQRAQMLRQGAEWDGPSKTWRMRGALMKRLGLLNSIPTEDPNDHL